MNASVIVSTWEQLQMKDTPLSTIIERARVIQDVQADTVIVANAVTDEKLQSANLEGLPPSKVGNELGLPVVQAGLAENLHEAGLLSKLKSEEVLVYLRSDEANADAASFADYLRRAEKRKAELDEELEFQGLPHSDYLSKSEDVRVPKVGQFVGKLSRLAKANGFEIPPPFKGSTLIQAVKKRILRDIGASDRVLASTVRACLRLIGDACVHVYATTDPKASLDMISSVMILPIVDSGFSTQRERLLFELLAEAFGPGMNVTRGGVVLGYRGFGKSQLVRQLVFGKELLQWSIGKRRFYDACRHVGMYVDSPSGLNDALQMGCPPALLAAGLCNAGFVQREDAPAWTKSIKGGFKAADVAEWVAANQVNAILVVDEAQRAHSDQSSEASTQALVARSKMFWGSLDACCENPNFPMTVITGTGSKVAHLVYTRTRGFDFEMQKDKFHMYWLDYQYSEVEICLMLTRQGKKSRLLRASMPWTPAYSPEDQPLDMESLSADEDKVLLEDLTLALALAVARASGFDPASDSQSGSPKPVDSHWVETGQVVHPSLDHVVEGIRADASGDLEAWRKTKAKPGRLTLQAAMEALEDERVLHAAYASRSKIVRRVWQTGMTARTLVGINSEESETNTKLQEWHDHMQKDTGAFRHIMLALLDCMHEANSNWQRDAFAKPLKQPESVTVESLLLRYGAMYPHAAVQDVQQFEETLHKWRLKQLVAYRAASERAGLREENQPSTVGFLSSMFAFLAMRWSLTRGLFVTRREFWAIHKQTGQLREDYELVVAESLHRNFVSKVLARDRMPSVPRYLWEKEDGALREDLVKHDRTQVFESGKISIQLTQSNWGKNPSREQLLGRVLKEVPDQVGGDLVVILEDTEERDLQKYHLIRIQVKAGGVDKVLKKESLDNFLSRKKVQAALQLYAGALGVRPEQLVMHRLLVTPKELKPNIKDLFPKRARSGGSGEDAGIAESSTSESVNDTTNLYYLDHNDYQEFLFADARLLSARIWANSADEFEERQRRRQKAKKLGKSLRASGLLRDDKRKVGLGEPSNMENWTEQFPINISSDSNSTGGDVSESEGDSEIDHSPDGNG